MSNLWDIVNGGQLPRFSGKKVSITGYVESVATNFMSFDIKAVDDVVVKVNLKRPCENRPEGYVEVHGISTGKSIQADDFIIFNNEKFDSKAHNTLCKLLYTVPNIWDIQ